MITKPFQDMVKMPENKESDLDKQREKEPKYQAKYSDDFHTTQGFVRDVGTCRVKDGTCNENGCPI